MLKILSVLLLFQFFIFVPWELDAADKISKNKNLPNTQNSTWPVSTPEEQGFDSKKLNLIQNFIKSKTGTTGFVVVVNGKIIYTYGDIKQVSYIASCRKSVLSMLYGIYVEKGKIKLDQTLKELNITDRTPLLPIEQTATVYDLITARSGIYLPAANEGGIPSGKEPPRGKTKPGTVFVYNNWDFNVAGTIFEKQTKISIYRALQKDLVKPLKMEDFKYSMHKKSGDRKKSKHLAYHMHFSTRDMARLGELMRLNGRWNGKQIIPEDWVKKSTSPVSVFPSGDNSGYGMMWWTLRDYKFPEEFKGAYTASGMYGQKITVIPALNMVVAHKSANNGKKPTRSSDYRKILHMIIQARIKTK